MPQANLNESKSVGEFLNRRIAKLSALLKQVKKKLNTLSLFRLVFFGLFSGSLLSYYLTRTDNRLYLLPIFVFFAVFLFLVFYYRKINIFRLRLHSYENLLQKEVLRFEFKLDTFYDYDIAINRFGLKNHFHRDHWHFRQNRIIHIHKYNKNNWWRKTLFRKFTPHQS
jgi:hypothetical protein